MPTKPIPMRGSDRMPAFAHATVGDVMHHGILTCTPDTDLVTVARVMAAHHIHALVVSGIEPDAQGERLVWGLISDSDLLEARKALVYGEAGGFPQTPVVTVEPGESLERAADLMTGNRLSHLIVVSPLTGLPTGIVSTLDLIGALAWGEG